MKKLELIGKKELKGYYKDENNNLYEIDFSNNPTSPIPVNTIPANIDTTTTYEPLSLSDKELKEFEENLKNIIGEFNNKEVKTIKDFENIEGHVCKRIRSLIEEKFSKVLVPSIIEYRSNILGKSGISAVVKFTKPIPTAWEKIEDYEDSVVVKGVNRVYKGEGEVIDIIDFSNLAVPRFYITDIDTTKKIEDILSKYLYIDANDISGHLLGAIYFIGIRLSNVSEDLEKLYERLREKEREEEKTALVKEKENFLRENREKIEFVVKNSERFGINVPDRIKDILIDINKVLYQDTGIIKRELDNLYREVKFKHEYYTDPKTVIFLKKGIAITVGDIINNNGVVELPKDVIGHFIGKKGENIKKLSKALGIKITVKEKRIEENLKNDYFSPRL